MKQIIQSFKNSELWLAEVPVPAPPLRLAHATECSEQSPLRDQLLIINKLKNLWQQEGDHFRDQAREIVEGALRPYVAGRR